MTFIRPYLHRSVHICTVPLNTIKQNRDNATFVYTTESRRRTLANMTCNTYSDILRACHQLPAELEQLFTRNTHRDGFQL